MTEDKEVLGGEGHSRERQPIKPKSEVGEDADLASDVAVKDQDEPEEKEESVTRFEYKEELGRGVLGICYRAYDHVEGEEVAIKLFCRATPKNSDKFKTQFEELTRLNHRGLATYKYLIEPASETNLDLEHLSGEEGLAFSEELIQGKNVRNWLKMQPTDDELQTLIDRRELQRATLEIEQASISDTITLNTKEKIAVAETIDLPPTSVTVDSESEGNRTFEEKGSNEGASLEKRTSEDGSEGVERGEVAKDSMESGYINENPQGKEDGFEENLRQKTSELEPKTGVQEGVGKVAEKSQAEIVTEEIWAEEKGGSADIPRIKLGESDNQEVTSRTDHFQAVLKQPKTVTETVTSDGDLSIETLRKDWDDSSEVAFELKLMRLTMILPSIIDALSYLHKYRKTDAALRPENILVRDSDGTVALTDYAIVPLLTYKRGSVEQSLLEAPENVAYLAPEVIESGASPSADRYALGCVLYELIAGRNPFDALEVGRKGSKLEIPPLTSLEPRCPAIWSSVVENLMSQDPEDRPQLNEVLSVLQHKKSDAVSIPMVEVPEVEEFVGRTEILEELRDLAMKCANENHLILTIIKGARGTGKTSLIREMCYYLAKRGWLVTISTCLVNSYTPYHGWHDLIRMLSQVLAALPPQEFEHFEVDLIDASTLFPSLISAYPHLEELRKIRQPSVTRIQAIEAFRTVLRKISQERPLFICIDNVQWASRDSSALLLDLFANDEGLRSLIVVSYTLDHEPSEEYQVDSKKPSISEGDNDILKYLQVTPLPLVELEIPLLESEDIEKLFNHKPPEFIENNISIQRLLRRNVKLIKAILNAPEELKSHLLSRDWFRGYQSIQQVREKESRTSRAYVMNDGKKIPMLFDSTTNWEDYEVAYEELSKANLVEIESDEAPELLDLTQEEIDRLHDPEVESILVEYYSWLVNSFSVTKKFIIKLLITSGEGLTYGIIDRAAVTEFKDTSVLKLHATITEDLNELIRLDLVDIDYEENGKTRYLVSNSLILKAVSEIMLEHDVIKNSRRISDALAIFEPDNKLKRFEFDIRAGRPGRALVHGETVARLMESQFAYNRASSIWRLLLEYQNELPNYMRLDPYAELSRLENLSGRYHEAAELYQMRAQTADNVVDKTRLQMKEAISWLRAGDVDRSRVAIADSLNACGENYYPKPFFDALKDAVTLFRLKYIIISPEQFKSAKALIKKNPDNPKTLTSTKLITLAAKLAFFVSSHAFIIDPMLRQHMVAILARATKKLPSAELLGMERIARACYSKYIQSQLRTEINLQLLDEADQFFKLCERNDFIATVMIERAQIFFRSDQQKKADEAFEKAIKFSKNVDDIGYDRSFALYSDATVSLKRGSFDSAEIKTRRMLQIFRGDCIAECRAYRLLTEISIIRGDIERAQLYQDLGTAILTSSNLSLNDVSWARTATKIDLALGRPEVAVARNRLLIEQLEAANLLSLARAVTIAFLNLGQSLAALLQLEFAILYEVTNDNIHDLKKVVQKLRSLQKYMLPDEKAEFLRLSARYYLLKNEPKKSMRNLRKAFLILDSNPNTIEHAKTTEAEAWVLDDLEENHNGESAKTRDLFADAFNAYQQLNCYFPLILEGWPSPNSIRSLQHE